MTQSLKRQARAKRKLTVKGTPDGRCIHQEMIQVGTYFSGEPKFMVKYLHVTKGWRTRILQPIHRRVVFG